MKIHPLPSTTPIRSISLFLALTSLSLSACAKKSDAPPDGPSQPHPFLQGPVTKAIQGLQASDRLEPCDQDTHRKSKQIEMAQELDRRSDEILKVSKDLPSSNRWKRVQVGPILVRERNFVPAPAEGWTEDSYDWDSIISFYQSIKGTPTDVNWLNLNMEVRGIVPDDQDRLEGYNVYNDKDSGKLIENVLKVVSDCVSSITCGVLTFDDDTSSKLSANPIYSYYLKRIPLIGGINDRRDLIVRLKNRLTIDQDRYLFRKNKRVTRTANGELHLPLDPGPFASGQDQIRTYIESMWNSDALKLKVDWTAPSPTLSELFSLVLEPGEGGRSFVNFDEKKVHLFDEVRAPSIAHEIGHVLGFTDHYYTVWHPEKCSYVTQSLPADLMSDPSDGAVTSDDWKELDSTYPTSL